MQFRRTLIKTSQALLLLAGVATTTVQADVAAERLEAIASATSGFGICLGTTSTAMGDVHPSPGDEILTVRKRLILRSDNDSDGNRVLSHIVSVIVKSSSTKQTLYETAPMAVNSRDIVVSTGNVGFTFNTLFNPGAYARFGIVFPFASECTGVTLATHNNQTYIVLLAGTSAIEGAPDAFTDHSRYRMRLSLGSDGSTVRTTSIYAQSTNFIVPFLPTITDLDDDGSQELLVWRMNPATNPNQLTVILRSYDLVSGVQEQFMAIPLNDRFDIEP